MTTHKSIADIIQGRRTIHQFDASKPIAEEVLVEALNQAVWAPNHHLTRPWHFYMLQAETVKHVCELNAEIVREKKGDKAARIKRRRCLEIPGWLLLTCDRSEDSIRMDEDYATCCCAAQNIALYLWDQAIGMKWTTGAVTRDARFFDIMKIDPQLEKVVGLFWYGYPDEIPVIPRQSVSAAVQYR